MNIMMPQTLPRVAVRVAPREVLHRALQMQPASARKAPARRARLCEVFADDRDGAGAAAVLAMAVQAAGQTSGGARDGRPLLWVQQRMATHEGGALSARGLAGRVPEGGVIRVAARNAADVLWVMEEGLRCKGLAGVIGEVWGAPAVLDFTASRRLSLRAEAYGVPAFLLHLSATPRPSVACERWRVRSLASSVHPFDPQSPGEARWDMELFRARWRRPGRWIGQHDRAAHRLDLAAPLRAGALADEPGEGKRQSA